MDGRESMVTSGSSLSSFYIQHRGVGRPGAPGPPPGLQGPHPGSGYRHHLDAGGAGFSFQHPHMGGNPHIGQGQVQGLHVETSPPVSQHAAVGGSTSASASIGMVSAAPGANAYADSKGAQESGGPSQDEQVKRKRGRPRKYKPDGAVTLGLSPSSSTPPSSSSGMVTVAGTPGSAAPSEKRARGRPPGSGKMQQLASLGKWLLGSVGTGFTPHVIIISPGEDVAARIMSFAQQGPRAICIMSATGAVSTATLHQDANSGTVIKYEGRFEILCLSGSYLVIDDGGSRTRTGGLCIALCGPDHKVIGGSVGGDLIAAGAVQVIVGSFMYAGSKKNKAKTKQDQENEEPNSPDEEGPLMTLPDDSISPHQMSGWPAMMRHMDSRSSNIDINSIRE